MKANPAPAAPVLSIQLFEVAGYVTLEKPDPRQVQIDTWITPDGRLAAVIIGTDDTQVTVTGPVEQLRDVFHRAEVLLSAHIQTGSEVTP